MKIQKVQKIKGIIQLKELGFEDLYIPGKHYGTMNLAPGITLDLNRNILYDSNC